MARGKTKSATRKDIAGGGKKTTTMRKAISDAKSSNSTALRARSNGKNTVKARSTKSSKVVKATKTTKTTKAAKATKVAKVTKVAKSASRVASLRGGTKTSKSKTAQRGRTSQSRVGKGTAKGTVAKARETKRKTKLAKSLSRSKGAKKREVKLANHIGADDKLAFPSEIDEVTEDIEVASLSGVSGGNGSGVDTKDMDLATPVYTLLRGKPRRQRSGIPDSLTLWGKELHKRPLLTHEQEVELAKRMEKGDEEARRIFIESNYRLVVSIAQRYRGCGVPLEDLIQAGNIGLIQAVDHYDWRQGTRFSTCAVMWIRQAILRAIDSHARVVRLSMRVSEQVHRIAAARQALMRELGRDPTIDEIARRVRLSKERVKELMGYMAQRVISLDDPVDIAEGLDADEVPSFSEYLADDPSSNPEEIIINREFKEAIEEAIKELPDRTQQAIKLRFGLEDNVAHTYDEIGYQLGLSRQRAMQLVQVGLQQLREHPKIKMLMALQG
ncbi:MAG: hypothetical protein RUDDFDWM_000073 [Candidatus Fervidibacterota bacterium]